MPEDYATQIKAAYDKMYKEGPISPYLKKPTPSNLRKHSLNLYRTKNTLRDKGIICDFLEINLKSEDLESIIRDAPLKKFKAVQYFFKSKTEEPRDYTIEFIAWLIDFKLDLNGQDHWYTDKENTIQEERPIEPPTLEKDVNDELENDGVPENGIDKDGREDNIKGLGKDEPITREEESGKGKRKKRYTYGIVVALGLLGGGAYFALNYKPNNTIQPFVTTDCMYWANDHYELVACNSAAGHVQHKIPFDAFEWKNLKKINCPDTLTDNDIGKVWYMKVKNDIELYTAKGRYPLDTNRVLRPLSKYMLDQYIPRKKKVAFLEWALKGISAVAIVAFLGLLWALWARASAKRARLSSP